MGYHPHVQFIVPGCGLSRDRSQWLSAKADFFVPAEALSDIFRAKFRDGLKKTHLFDAVPSDVWLKDRVVHCKPVGNANSALKYLAPYVYRTAITNNRIEKLENDRVSFRFKKSDTDQWQTVTLPAPEFIHRFLQHLLPKGFVKIRYYGFLSVNKGNLLAVAKYLLSATDPDPETIVTQKTDYICPDCGAKMRRVQSLPKLTRAPP